MTSSRPHASSEDRGGPARDSSGYPIFSAGEAGAAHAMAHRMLDTGRTALGHRLLGRWLEGRAGSGSEWVHLHWHMAIFELALGRLREARARLEAHILPAVPAGDSLTDAPALLWRLELAAPAGAELPWAPVREIALRALAGTLDPFVEMHQLLALAGAVDLEGIEGWLSRGSERPSRRPERLVRRVALALRDRLRGDAAGAARALAGVLPLAGLIGGSRAQRGLLDLIHHRFRSEAAGPEARELRPAAA